MKIDKLRKYFVVIYLHYRNFNTLTQKAKFKTSEYLKVKKKVCSKLTIYKKLSFSLKLHKKQIYNAAILFD